MPTIRDSAITHRIPALSGIDFTGQLVNTLVVRSAYQQWLHDLARNLGFN
jgi:hypothetical protein